MVCFYLFLLINVHINCINNIFKVSLTLLDCKILSLVYETAFFLSSKLRKENPLIIYN